MSRSRLSPRGRGARLGVAVFLLLIVLSVAALSFGGRSAIASGLDDTDETTKRAAQETIPPQATSATPTQGIVGRSGPGRRANQPPIATRRGSRIEGGKGPVQCEKCHADRSFLAGKARNDKGDSVLFVPDTSLRDSRHETLVCADCHAGYNDGYPHGAVPSVAVSCDRCHENQGKAFHSSIHSTNIEKQGDAPTCVSCHSAHRVLGIDDPRSPTYPLNVAQLCGSCHAKAEILETYYKEPTDSAARSAVDDYRHSVHGLAMSRAGLTVSATCSDCHGAHGVLPVDSAASTLSRANVKATCGACHAGVLSTFDSSAHGAAFVSGDTTDTGQRAPVCIECHGGHKIESASNPQWFAGVVTECGRCHERLLHTYFETYHGKATVLGSGIAAKCSDCHTPHAMRPAKDTLSSVHPANLVATCGACHTAANANFVLYKPHADPRDKERNPELHVIWLLMTSLLVGVFGFFGLHSLLWFFRLLAARREGDGGAIAHKSAAVGGTAAPNSAPAAEAPPQPSTPPSSGSGDSANAGVSTPSATASTPAPAAPPPPASSPAPADARQGEPAAPPEAEATPSAPATAPEHRAPQPPPPPPPPPSPPAPSGETGATGSSDTPPEERS